MTLETRKTTLELAAALLGLSLFTACEVEDFDDADLWADDEESVRASKGWTPRTIDPSLCEEGEISRPPTNGQCSIELRLIKTKLVTGQGASETRAELSTVVTATAPNNTQVVASVPEMKYNPGESKGHDMSLGTYDVAAGNQKNIAVCAEFTEDDNGGVNGQDDVGTACANVQLSCDPVVGQPTFKQVIGPAALCGPNQCNGSASATVQVMRADADYDNVPNADDFTPEPCDELEKGTEGVALVLYYHYDDDLFTSLAQSMGTNISKNFPAYDYVALVMDNAVSNAVNLDAAAFKDANVVYEPSRDGLLEAMRHVTSLGYRFDVKTHAHGTEVGALDSQLEVLTGDPISGDWLIAATEPDLVGTARGGIPIIALWGTACFQGRQIDAWDTIGALVGSGANHVNFVPNAWMNYWDSWVAGVQYRPAVDTSVTVGVLAATEGAILLQGAGAPWWCAVPTVLGQNPCAEDFFNDDVGPNDAAYNLEDIYDHSLSGAANMEISSQRSFVGDQTTTFGGGLAVWP
jgi:hypothetical protein